MGDERQQPSPRISRRAFLREGGKVTAAVGAGALLAKAGTGTAEVASPTEDIRHLEEIPGIDFHPIQIEGEPIKDSLATGPKGFWFHAKNGQTVGIVAEELNGGNYLTADLYNAFKIPVQVNTHGRIQATVSQTGDYFLVVSRRTDDSRPEATDFQAQVKEALEHGIQVSFLLHPNKGFAPFVRFPNETATILPEADFGVVLDFNEMDDMIPSDRDPNLQQAIRVYAQKGGPEQVLSEQLSFPEEKPENEISYRMDRLGDGRGILFPVVKGPDGKKQMVKEWPSDSHIAVVVDHPQMRWVTRFFILERKGAPKG